MKAKTPLENENTEKRAKRLKLETRLQLAAIGVNAFAFICALIVLVTMVATGQNDHSPILIPIVGFFAFTQAFSAGVLLFRLQFWKIKKRLLFDRLTSVLDHVAFEEKLQEELLRAGRYHFQTTLCYIDVDEFKRINKEHGRYYGDELLQKFTQIVLSHIRSSDHLARVQNDEFYLLLTHTDIARAEKFLYRLLLQVQERLDVSFSVGLTAYRTGETREDITKRVHEALGRAKKEGRKKTRCVICKDDSRVVMSFDFGRESEKDLDDE